jgi:hypothetical protein
MAYFLATLRYSNIGISREERPVDRLSSFALRRRCSFPVRLNAVALTGLIVGRDPFLRMGRFGMPVFGLVAVMMVMGATAHQDEPQG